MKYFLLSFCLICTHFVIAQSARSGFVFSAAFGASSLHLSSGHQFGASLPNFKIGAMFNARTALVMVLPGSVYRYKTMGRTRDRGFEGFVPSVQYWPKERWWLLAGAGVGMDAPAFYDIKDASERKFYFGYAGLIGTGYEVWRHGRFALDVQSRAHFGVISVENKPLRGIALSIGIGLNWY